MQASLGQFTAVAELLLSVGASPWELMRDGFPRQVQRSDGNRALERISAIVTNWKDPPPALRQVRRLGFRRILRAGGSLRELPETLGECRQLEVLNLNGCVDLRRLPDSIGECEALRELACRGCVALSALPDTLGGLQKLEVLDVTGCAALTSLPTTLRLCSRLKSLDVTGCDALNGLLDVELIQEVRARGEAENAS